MSVAAPEPPLPGGEIPYLTPMRGIAAMCVAARHVILVTPSLAFLDQATNLFFRAYLWVDFFFVLSGFVLAHAYGKLFASGADRASFARFVKARFARIYPLHLFMLLGFLGFAALRSGLIGAPVFAEPQRTLEGFLLSLALLQSMGLLDDYTWNFPAWSISVEWYSYLLFPFLATRLTKKGARWTAAVVSAAALAALAGVRGHLDITFDYGFLRCLAEVTIGVCAYAWAKERDFVRGRAWPPYLFLAAAFLAMHPDRETVSDLAPAAIFPLLIVSLAQYRGTALAWLEARPLRALGDWSYSIYLSHILVKDVFASASTRLWPGFDSDPAAGVAYLSAVLFGVVLFSASTYRFVERPARDWIRGRLSGSGGSR